MARTVVGGSAQTLLEVLRAPDDDAAVLWSVSAVDAAAFDAAATYPLIGTVSPMPVAAAPVQPTRYEVHPQLPPPPPLPRPCDEFVLFTAEAVELLRRDLPTDSASVAQLIAELGRRLTALGYQHVGAPGLAARWSPAAVREGVAPTRYDLAMDSASNVSLAAHRLWAATRLRPMKVVLDGACVTADAHTGTQRVILEVSRALAALRPTAQVVVAVLPEFVSTARTALAGSGVDVTERRVGSAKYDAVYRPYQMLRAQELDWCERVAERMIVSQLDMIGFSNPTYHPSSELFFLARNLQRTMMLEADGVTFISEFGRSSAMMDVAELDASRTTVVSCGSDTDPLDGVKPAAAPRGRFVLVLSATFTHKNRAHAIAAFAEAVVRHRIEGSLVIAGPEPFYGRSTEEERRLVEERHEILGERVIWLGQVSDREKWWLLRNASAVLYPSTVEGFGLVPFEAAAVGTPCLAFRGTALGEILGDGVSTVAGWRVGVWAEALANLLNDDGTAAAAALAHVRHSAAVHTWAACGELTWEAIDHAIAMPPRVRVASEGSAVAAVRPSRRVVPFIAGRAFYLRLMPFLQRRLQRLRRQ